MIRSILPSDYRAIEALEQLEYDEEALRPPYSGLCIEEKRELKGYLLVESRADRWTYVRAIGIHPDYRNQGLGTRLIQALQVDEPAILLRTEPDTAHLARFYQRLGFRVTLDPSLQSPVPGVTSWVWERHPMSM